MGELTDRVRAARPFLETAIQHVLEVAEALDNSTQTVVDVAVGQWVVTAGSDGCRVNGTPAGSFTLRKGDVYALNHNIDIEENLVALRTALSECIAQRDELRAINTNLHAQIANYQEFNDKQRQQLESLQKEMAAIHMLVSATSHTKLDDAVSMHGRELPFLLNAVYETMIRYFNTKARVNDNVDTRALDVIGELLINCSSVSDMMEVFQRYTEKHPAVERVYQCKQQLLQLQKLLRDFKKATEQ